MIVALLEFTQVPNGEVLEQLLVIPGVETASTQLPAQSASVNRVRLFAQVESDLCGVPTGVYAHLECAALAGLNQVERQRTNAKHEKLAPFIALWHRGKLQELNSISLAHGLAFWLREAGQIDESVLIEICSSTATIETPTGASLKPFYVLLRDKIANRMQRRYRSVQSSSELPAGDAIGTASSGLNNLTAGESVMLKAATQREALAAQWLSAAQVDARFSAPASGNGHCASELHRADHLLGVYVASPMPSYPYPPWQFRLDGRPLDQLTKILAVLRDFGPFPLGVNDLRRTTGWGRPSGSSPLMRCSMLPHLHLRWAPMRLVFYLPHMSSSRATADRTGCIPACHSARP